MVFGWLCGRGCDEVIILLNVKLHKFDMSAIERGGERAKNLSVKGALVKKLVPMADIEGMDMLSMLVSMVGRSFSIVASPIGS